MTTFQNPNPGGFICPECSADGCGGWYPVVNDEGMWIESECMSCAAHWRDAYAPDDPVLAAMEECPHCGGSFSVLLDNENIDGYQASVHASCEQCGREWTETHHYTHSTRL